MFLTRAGARGPALAPAVITVGASAVCGVRFHRPWSVQSSPPGQPSTPTSAPSVTRRRAVHRRPVRAGPTPAAARLPVARSGRGDPATRSRPLAPDLTAAPASRSGSLGLDPDVAMGDGWNGDLGTVGWAALERSPERRGGTEAVDLGTPFRNGHRPTPPQPFGTGGGTGGRNEPERAWNGALERPEESSSRAGRSVTPRPMRVRVALLATSRHVSCA